MWHLMPDGRYAVTVTVDGRKDTTKLVSVALSSPALPISPWSRLCLRW